MLTIRCDHHHLPTTLDPMQLLTREADRQRTSDDDSSDSPESRTEGDDALSRKKSLKDHAVLEEVTTPKMPETIIKIVEAR